MEMNSLFNKQKISENYELEESSLSFKNIKLPVDEDLFTGCEYINHFPSFNNLSLESLVALKLNQDSGLSMEKCLSDPTTKNPTSLLKHNFKNIKTPWPSIVALNWTAAESNQRIIKNIQINAEKAKVHIEQQNSRSKLRSNKNEAEGCHTDQQALTHSKALFAESDESMHQVQDEWSKDSDSPLNALNSSNKQIRHYLIQLQIKIKRRKEESLSRDGAKIRTRLGTTCLIRCAQNKSFDIDNFFCIDQSTIIDEDSQEFISQEHSKIIKQIARKYNWMKKPIYLYFRFRKIYLKESTLSVREFKLLKKLLIKNKDEEDIDKLVMYHFPGKSQSVIEQAKKEFMKSKRFSKFMKDYA